MPDARPIELIARGVVVHEGCVLLCRSLSHGYAYLPGGHVEFGEQAARALERELEEEIGLPARVGRCLLVTEERFDVGGVLHHEINIVFHVEQLGASAEPPRDVSSREAKIGFEWVHLAALHETDLRPATIKAWLMAGQTGATTWVSGMD